MTYTARPTTSQPHSMTWQPFVDKYNFQNFHLGSQYQGSGTGGIGHPIVHPPHPEHSPQMYINQATTQKGIVVQEILSPQEHSPKHYGKGYMGGKYTYNPMEGGAHTRAGPNQPMYPTQPNPPQGRPPLPGPPGAPLPGAPHKQSHSPSISPGRSNLLREVALRELAPKREYPMVKDDERVGYGRPYRNYSSEDPMIYRSFEGEGYPQIGLDAKGDKIDQGARGVQGMQACRECRECRECYPRVREGLIILRILVE